MDKIISEEQIAEATAKAVYDLCINLTCELKGALINAIKSEKNERARNILEILLKNAEIAKEDKIPTCQDTGMVCCYAQIGEQVRIKGSLFAGLNKGVAKAYTEGYLRKSVVRDPLRRINTGDNTPVALTTELTEGDKLKITFLLKGAGAENKSRLKMLVPADGKEGVKQFVLESVILANGEPCPPVVIGVGIGGNFDKCTFLAKKALYRPLGKPHPEPFYADFEKELLEEVNKLGIGPQGLGGSTTALAVHIEYAPCHLASLPCAVNIDCHAHRRAEIEF